MGKAPLLLAAALLLASSAWGYSKKDVDCLERCLQERGARNYKTARATEKQCLTVNAGNPELMDACTEERKSVIRRLEYVDIQTCSRSCN